LATLKLLVYQRCHCWDGGVPADVPRASKAVLAAKIAPQRISVRRYGGCQTPQREKREKNDFEFEKR
jgi:hypothetical protein